MFSNKPHCLWIPHAKVRWPEQTVDSRSKNNFIALFLLLVLIFIFKYNLNFQGKQIFDSVVFIMRQLTFPCWLLQILSITCTDGDALSILTYQILSCDHGHFTISVQGDIIVANGKNFLNWISIELRFLVSFSRVFVIFDW